MVSAVEDRNVAAHSVAVLAMDIEVKVEKGEEGQGMLMVLSLPPHQHGKRESDKQRYQAFQQFADKLQWPGSTMIFGPRVEEEDDQGKKTLTGPVMSYALTHAEADECGVKLGDLAARLALQEKDEHPEETVKKRRRAPDWTRAV